MNILPQIINHLYPKPQHWRLVDRNESPLRCSAPDGNEYYQIRHLKSYQILASITIYGTQISFTRYANGATAAPTLQYNYIQLQNPNAIQQLKELIDPIQNTIAQEQP